MCAVLTSQITQNNLQIEKFAYFDICFFIKHAKTSQSAEKKQNIPNMNRVAVPRLKFPYIPQIKGA